MSDAQGATYDEWTRFVAEVTAELEVGGDPGAPPGGAGVAPDAGRRETGRTLRAVALAVAVLVPAALGPGELPDLEGFDLGPLEAEQVQLLPAPAEEPRPWPPWFERVVERFERKIAHLEEDEHRRLAETLVAEAQLARMDPLLVLAVIQVESSYDPDARSDKGALGLMQLLGPTLREEAERAGVKRANPLDPATNVRMGIRYLGRLLDMFGRQDVALMAYNAGPNRIRGYLRDGGIPERFWEYPRRVKAELRRLRRAYPELRATQGPVAALGPQPQPTP